MENGESLATYPVSTSKFGLGDNWGRMTTPLGFLQVAQKIGDHAPVGAVFHNRRFTGEIIKPNAPGRDPVITRIIWLRGLQASNAHAFSRCIYIHGTPEEKLIGRPASYGCIRMKSRDVAALYAQVPLGAIVEIVPDRLPKVPKAPRGTAFTSRREAGTRKSNLPQAAEKASGRPLRKSADSDEQSHWPRCIVDAALSAESAYRVLTEPHPLREHPRSQFFTSQMANTRSASKRARQTTVRSLRNRSVLTRLRKMQKGISSTGVEAGSERRAGNDLGHR